MSPATLPTSSFIRALRNGLNLSQEKFAPYLGVSFQTINHWEKGRATPSQMAMTLIELQLRQMGERGADLMSGLFSRVGASLSAIA